MKKQYYEWTDEVEAMRSALRVINGLLLKTPDLEESARDEAKRVKKQLPKLDKSELIDALMQATIDLGAA